MEPTSELNEAARQAIRNQVPRTLLHSIDIEAGAPNTAQVLLEDAIESFVYAVGRERARRISKLIETTADRLDTVAEG